MELAESLLVLGETPFGQGKDNSKSLPINALWRPDLACKLNMEQGVITPTIPRVATVNPEENLNTQTCMEDNDIDKTVIYKPPSR